MDSQIALALIASLTSLAVAVGGIPLNYLIGKPLATASDQAPNVVFGIHGGREVLPDCGLRGHRLIQEERDGNTKTATECDEGGSGRPVAAVAPLEGGRSSGSNSFEARAVAAARPALSKRRTDLWSRYVIGWGVPACPCSEERRVWCCTSG